MHTSRLIQSVAAFGMLFGVTQIVHADLISNGSFESGIYAPPSNDTMSLSVGATNITGWTVVSDVIAWIGPSSPWLLTASTGDFFLDLTDYSSGAPFGGVSQTVSTTPGQAYQLSFDLGSSNRWGRPSAILASAGSTSGTFTSALTGGNSDWQSFMLPFTASSTSTTISLTGKVGQNYIGLDNVTVTPVPEPTSYIMMIAGLGLLGFTVRRKHRA